jgi:cytochrome c oxidase subunit II
VNLWAQNALDPAGPQAGGIATLWWVLLAVTGIVYLVVMGVLFGAVFGSMRRSEAAVTEHSRLVRAVGLAIGLTAAILLGLMVTSVATGRPMSHLHARGAMAIDVTGHQWWWELTYPDTLPSNTFTTANEIHIPTGRRVLIRATADDVIHSLWAPNLHGKIDLIPGRVNAMWIQADRPGSWHGQCAEFCGLQHAHMGLVVVAQPPREFESWLQAQRRPASQPADDEQRRGLEVLEGQPCILCHAIRGTRAQGQVGPDLTHLGSRLTIAAGTLQNTPGNLGGWITDSHRIKPGNRMPPIAIRQEDLTPLVAYLENLK